MMIRDGRIPRPIRWLGALALLPVPGPFDEAALLLVTAILIVFYKREMRDAWRRASGIGRVRPVTAPRRSDDVGAGS